MGPETTTTSTTGSSSKSPTEGRSTSPTEGKSTSPTEGSSTKVRIKPHFSYIGISLCVLTNVGLAVVSIIVKSLSMPSIQKNFARTSIQYFLLLPFISYHDMKGTFRFFGPPRMFKVMVVRAIVGNISSICVYYAVSKMPVGDAVALTFFSTILTGIFGHIWLKEPFTKVDRFCALLSIGGVILICKPHFLFGGVVSETVNQADHIQGIIAAIMAAFLIAATVVLVRHLAHLNPALTIFYFSFWGTCLTSSVSWIIYGDFYVSCRGELPMSLAHGLLGLLCQMCMAMALRYERAVTFAICRSLQIVIVFVIQIVVLEDPTNWASVSGASLILISAIGIGVRKLFSELESGQATPGPVISDDVLVAA